MLILKNGYGWHYDQNKQNFSFRTVAHLEFPLYGDFWLSHHADCATFQKTFSCQKCDYEINSSAPSLRFKIKLIKGITIGNSILWAGYTYLYLQLKHTILICTLCPPFCLRFNQQLSRQCANMMAKQGQTIFVHYLLSVNDIYKK